MYCGKLSRATEPVISAQSPAFNAMPQPAEKSLPAHTAKPVHRNGQGSAARSWLAVGINRGPFTLNQHA
jgi:hypothetical protein